MKNIIRIIDFPEDKIKKIENNYSESTQNVIQDYTLQPIRDNDWMICTSNGMLIF